MSIAPRGWSRPESPFHAGELAVQARAGALADADRAGRIGIRDYLPEQHRDFYAQLPWLFVASVDAGGQPWASVLAGVPGFLHSPDPATLRIDAHPLAGDVLGAALRPGARLGLLGIELATRRRNRLNGDISSVDEHGFTLAVAESFGNCPQYIQRRAIRAETSAGPRQVRESAWLEAADQALIAAADTFFIASATAQAGADVSHRGGRPGFVGVEDQHTLVFPDFAGNQFFQTLGNLHEDPRAGLLFIDFASGDVLQLAGRATVVWDGAALDAYAGAERLVRVRIERVRRLVDAVTLRWSAPEPWPMLAHTGTWQQAATALQASAPAPVPVPQPLAQPAAAWRAYRIVHTQDEGGDIRSLLLQPEDGGAVPAHVAGQFLPVRLPPAAGETAHLMRSYTLSHAANGRYLQISVKRQGAASGWLHAQRAGALIEAQLPRGHFIFDVDSGRPAVMLSAGVGITPMIAMLDGLLAARERPLFAAPIYFVHASRSAAQQAFATFLSAVPRLLGNVAIHLVHGQAPGEPGAGSPAPGLSCHHGRLDIGLLKTILPFDDYDFYLCGPQGFQQGLYDGLRALRIPDDQIHAEAFGGNLLRRDADPADARPAAASGAGSAVPVRFARSGCAATWQPGAGALLALAEAQGLAPASGCRSGNCGACATRLLSGAVHYLAAPSVALAADQVLPCIAVPAATPGHDGVVLDL